MRMRVISIIGTVVGLGAAEMVQATDLVTPPMTDEAPAPGKRVRQVAPEYAGTDVYHSLYLPTDWKAGKRYPVVVEYTGNKYPPGKGSGEVKDANLGYGLTGGKQCLWVVMPYVENGGQRNAVTWWGDRDATVAYCKTNLPRLCAALGGDPQRVVICGFSRGAIGASYLGLADDQIARLWKAFYTHDHFDGHREWGYAESDRLSALKRLGRLKGRPVLVSEMPGLRVRESFLKDHLALAQFSFVEVPTAEILPIPEAPFFHPHTDLWMHRPSEQRTDVHRWLQAVLAD